MAEWSIATDCKSVALWATKVRILLGAQKMDFSIKVDEELSLKLRHEEDTKAVFNRVEKNRAHLKPWLPWVDRTL